MSHFYEIILKFYGGTAKQSALKKYDRLASTYNISRITRNTHAETTTLKISSKRKMTSHGIEKILGAEIPIISFKKME